jgi:hypothetical protein
MADGGGARPESERGRGFRWSEAVVRARGAVGKSVALERGTEEEWVMEERTVFQARFENGRSAAPGSGPSTVRVGDVRRARIAGQKQRGGTDRWVTAQCRAAVPLIGGSGLSAARGRESRARGPAREGKRWAEPR